MSFDKSDSIPTSWISAELGQLVEVVYGKALSEKHRVSKGMVPVVGSSGIVGKHNETLVDGPCVVIGRKGAAGSVHLISESCWPIDTAYYIQPPSEISLRFLAYQLGTFDLVTLDKSTAIPSLSRDDLYRVSIAVAAAAEQTRIVAKLEELLSDLDAGVAELRAAQKKLTQYRQSLLKAAVEGALTKEWRERRKAELSLADKNKNASTGSARAEKKKGSTSFSYSAHPELVEGLLSVSDGSVMFEVEAETGAQLLTRILKERRARWEAKQLAKFESQGKAPPKDWQEKYPEPVKPDTTNLPELPERWVWATIDQLGLVGTGVTPLKSNSAYYSSGTIPWVTSGALNDEEVTSASEFVTPFALEKCRLEVYPAGALLVAMYGEGKTRGKCAELMIPATINQAIAAIILESEAKCCKEYIKTYLLNSYEKMRSQASGGVQPNLNLQIVKSLVLPLPPIAEQSEVVHALENQLELTRQQHVAVTFGLKQSIAQRKNILKAAFSGQLVPQDPNDEPASVLLERIRAERAARDGGKLGKARKTGTGK